MSESVFSDSSPPPTIQSMNDFERKHPRAKDGKFTEKHRDESGLTLTAPDPFSEPGGFVVDQGDIKKHLDSHKTDAFTRDFLAKASKYRGYILVFGNNFGSSLRADCFHMKGRVTEEQAARRLGIDEKHVRSTGHPINGFTEFEILR